MITRKIDPRLQAAGFIDPDLARRQGKKFRRLMIGIDGPWDTGKTEFALSAPGPGACLALDRNFDALFDNPNPPPTRQHNFGFLVVKVPKATQLAVTQNANPYLEYWREFYKHYTTALDLPDEACRTVILDGDTDSWELQRLAEFGRLSKVPSNLYDNVNAARRAMYARAFDSGKIIIATNRVRKEYATVIDPATQQPKLNSSGNEVREWTGDYERQGFSDQDYLWNIQLRAMREDTDKGPQFGIKIMKCKADPSLIGQELWGPECNFQTLVQLVYPTVSLTEWGY